MMDWPGVYDNPAAALIVMVPDNVFKLKVSVILQSAYISPF
jgi:hypothetical protein